MAYIMGLEGPRPQPIDRLRGRLFESIPKPIYRATVPLSGIFDPIKARPWLAVGGVLLGAWLAGTASGQKLVRRVRGRR